jgi:hypothetical protein
VKYVLLLGLVVGCSQSGRLGQVEGTVLLDGQPLPNAIVEFQPEGKGRPSVAETGPDGKYKLRFSKHQWGAVLGKHKVLITTFSPSGDGQLKERVPAAYNTNTTLFRDVQSQPNWIDFDLQTDTPPQSLSLRMSESK